MVDSVNSLFELKFGHSVALHGSLPRYSNSNTVYREGQLSPNQVRPKSKLLFRAPSSPCFVPDLDLDMVLEDRNRRYQVHSAAMSNPQIFRRTITENSLCHLSNKKHHNRHFSHIHPLSDPADRCPPKTGYSYSKKLTEHDFFSKHEDFVKPKNPVSDRQTGYNRGHVRSILEFDTFGPEHSAKVCQQREEGSVPSSPNSDRYSQQSRSPSPNGSRASTAASFNGGGRPGSKGGTVRGSRGGSSLELELLGTKFENGILARSGNLPAVIVPVSFNKSHKIYDDTSSADKPVKLALDSHTQGITWFLNRKEKLNRKKLQKSKKIKNAQQKEHQEKEAKQFQNLLDKFENNLRAIKQYS